LGIYSNQSPYYSWSSVSDSGSPIVDYEIAVGTNGNLTDISNWSSVGLKNSYVYLGGSYSEGAYYQLSVRAVDAAGNKGAYATKVWAARPIDPTWNQQAKFKAANLMPGDRYGHTIAADGDRIVVGSPDEDSTATGANLVTSPNTGATNSGAAYVYKRDVNGTWALEGYLKSFNTTGGQGFGYAVAISGDTIAVGAPLETANATGVSATASTTFTGSNYGAVYTYKYNGTQWNKENYIKPNVSQIGSQFGQSLALSGNTLVVGAPYYSPSGYQAGAAYVFTRATGSNWAERQILKESTAVVTNRFGWSVSVHEDKIAVGSSQISASMTGTVEIYEPSGASWTRTAKIFSHNPHAYDEFGHAVSIYKDRVAIAAVRYLGNTTGVTVAPTAFPTGLSGSNVGAVSVWEKKPTWVQTAFVQPTSLSGQNFGHSLSLFDNTLVVGAHGHSGGGRIYVYKIPASGSYTANKTYSQSYDSNATFGHSVAISNSMIAVGGYNENSASGTITNYGEPYTHSPGSGSGAAWVFEASVP
jgi:hypothetical protein